MKSKIFSALIIFLIMFSVEATPSENLQEFPPTEESQELNEIPQKENSQPLETLTSENSGLNPGYRVTPIKNPRPVLPDDKLPNVTAISAIVIEASTGHVIYERNADKKMFPASTTKMMTLVMALEYGKLNEIVTVSKNASGAEGSTVWLEVGEKISLRDLMYGMMLVSGNDAAISIAEHIGGNVKNFSYRMTRRARELGATGTNFTNPNGLPDENHFTTAKDLATLTAYAYTLDGFEEIVSTKEKIFPRVNDDKNILRNENRMLELYRGGNGVKTGYTDAAGRCLISAANRDGVQLIAVVLDSYYIWNDSIALLDYGFEHVETKTLVKSGEVVKTLPIISGRKKSMKVKTAEKIVVPVFKDSDTYKIDYDIPKFLTAPVKKGESVGKIRVICDGREIRSVDVVATADVEQKSFFRMLFDNFIKIFLKDKS